MKRLFRNAVLLWIAATTVHLPFPLVDCDDLANGQSIHPCKWHVQFLLSERFLVDIEFVLLGCDPPDEQDEGPMDRDPEGGNAFSGPYPIFLTSEMASDSLHQERLAALDQQVWHACLSAPLPLPPCGGLAGGCLNLVPMNVLIASTTVLRC